MPPTTELTVDQSSVETGHHWSRVQLFAVQTATLYFALLLLYSLADGSNATRQPLASLQAFVVREVVGLAGGPPPSAASGWATYSAASVVISLASTGIVACLLAALWMLMDRRRSEHRTLHLWLRSLLRYYTAVVTLIYGGFKVINSQFPPLQLDQLLQPLGTLTPMSLLWNYMGYSDAYSAFAGFGEVLGAVLLFDRRTVSLGAAVLLAVMGNVALINFAYDVPVKGLSTNLVIIALVLLAPDARRLLDVFVRNRATSPRDDARHVGGPRLARVRRVLKPVIVVLAVGAPMVVSSRVRPTLHQRSPLYGIYEANTFVRNGDTLPALLGNTGRWRWVTFDALARGSIQYMNDSLARLVAKVDTGGRVLSFERARGQASGTFTYDERPPGTLFLQGQLGSDSIAVTLVRLDLEHRFRLSRGFRWFGS